MEESSATDKIKNQISNNTVRNLLFLDVMLTPKIITFIYWIMIVCIVIGGIMVIASGSIVRGLAFLFLGTVFVRIWCEVSIIFFKMNEALQEMRNK